MPSQKSTMGIHPHIPSRGASAFGPLVSLAAHAAVAVVLLQGPGLLFSPGGDTSHILPALYLYAPDRQPSDVREMRIPIPAPLGIANGGVARVPRIGGMATAPPAARPQGLPEPGPSAPRIDSVYSVLSVDAPVERLPESAAPAYPVDLLRAGVEGSVIAEFVVDADGRVDQTTVRILASTDSAFTGSVRTALVGMRFRPARRGDGPVRQLVQQRFSFNLIQPPPPVSM